MNMFQGIRLKSGLCRPVNFFQVLFFINLAMYSDTQSYWNRKRSPPNCSPSPLLVKANSLKKTIYFWHPENVLYDHNTVPCMNSCSPWSIFSRRLWKQFRSWFYTCVIMKVIGGLDFNELNEWVKTFSDIVYVCILCFILFEASLGCSWLKCCLLDLWLRK